VLAEQHAPVAGNGLLAVHCSVLDCNNELGCCACAADDGNDVTAVKAPEFDSQRA